MRRAGFTLVTVLGVLVVLAIAGLLISSNAVREQRQSAASVGLAQARASAEAAQADAQFYLSGAGLRDIGHTLQGYVDTFTFTRRDTAREPIINTDSAAVRAEVLARLGALAGTSVSGDVDGRAYRARTHFTNFTADERSFSSSGQTYHLDFRIDAHGASGEYRRNVHVSGTLRVRLGRTSLNQFLLLADDGGSGENGQGGFFDSTLTYDGPVHINRNVALTGRPNFLEGLSTSASSVWMDPTCTYRFQQTSTQTRDCTQPNYNGYGLNYDLPGVPLPANGWSQARAALGLDTTDTRPVSDEEACRAVRAGNCQGGLGAGVYLPTDGRRPTGGVFVQGDATISLSVDGGHQVIRVTDAAGVTTTLTLDRTLNRTTIRTDAGTTVLNGLPNGQVYVTGRITSLGGPTRPAPLPSPAPERPTHAQVPPAVAKDSQLNITAGGDVTLTGDLTYEADPREHPEAQNVLGIISGTGSVNVGTAAPNDLYVHAAILAGAPGKGFGVVRHDDRSRGPRGRLHLLGSAAESSDQLRGMVDGTGRLIAGYSDAWTFDRRFGNGAVAPPFFPTTDRYTVLAGWPVQHTWTEN